MSPNSRRAVSRRLSFNSCLLLVGFACLTALTLKAGANLSARGFSITDKAFISAPDELTAKARLREGYGRLFYAA